MIRGNKKTLSANFLISDGNYLRLSGVSYDYFTKKTWQKLLIFLLVFFLTFISPSSFSLFFLPFLFLYVRGCCWAGMCWSLTHAAAPVAPFPHVCVSMLNNVLMQRELLWEGDSAGRSRGECAQQPQVRREKLEGPYFWIFQKLQMDISKKNGFSSVLSDCSTWSRTPSSFWHH